MAGVLELFIDGFDRANCVLDNHLYPNLHRSDAKANTGFLPSSLLQQIDHRSPESSLIRIANAERALARQSLYGD